MKKISAKYNYYQDLIDRTIIGLRDLFACSCRPMVIARQDGTFESPGIDHWISEDALVSYRLMQDHLKELLHLQSKTIIETLGPEDIMTGPEVDQRCLNAIRESTKEYFKENTNV